jgi:hypothetical protein
VVRHAAGTLVISLALAVAGCGTPSKTMTGSEAIRRLDNDLSAALKAAPSDIPLIRVTAEATSGSGCTKPLQGSGFTGQVKADVAYEAKDVRPEAAQPYLDAIERLWKRKGRTYRTEKDHVVVYFGGSNLFATHRPEARMMTVGGNSPCVWVNGTPGPGDDP